MSYKDIKLIPNLDSIKYEEMSDERYFSKEFSGYISNSKLSLINPDQGGSPEMYIEGLSKHPKFSDSLILGSAVHELLLQPNGFKLVDNINRPTAKLGAMADILYDIYRKNKINNNIEDVTFEDIVNASDIVDYYKGKIDAIKQSKIMESCSNYWEMRYLYEIKLPQKEYKVPIFLDEKSRAKLLKCLESAHLNKNIQSLLYPESFFEDDIEIKNEAALFMDVDAIYDDKKITLKLKAKLDNFTIDSSTNTIVLNDLKTTGHYLSKFKESYDKYHYYRQMAMYIWMLTLYAKSYCNIDKIGSLTANMLLISTVPDYYSGVFKVSKNDIDRGFNEFSDLLKRVAEIELTNVS
jgi:hypothetical protein